MGGSEQFGWLAAFDAAFDAAIAHEEEVAAGDLAFSLRQDVGVREAVVRSGTGWVLVGPEAAALPVDEIGVDYVRSGPLVTPIARAVLRSGGARVPEIHDRRLTEMLGAACRTGAEVSVAHCAGVSSGRLVRVGNDHLGVVNGDTETIVGLSAVESVRLGKGAGGYSASRGFNG